MQPFSIVEDDGFHVLMKTGQPEYYIPSRLTVNGCLRCETCLPDDM